MRDRTGKLPSIFRGARGGMLILLACGAAVGLCFDYVALAEYFWEQKQRGGDGLGMFFPMIAVCMFAPIQLGAVLAIRAALRRRRELTQADAEPVSSVTFPTVDLAAHPELLELDDGMFERLRAQKFARAAFLMLGAPAAVMTLCALLSQLGIASGLVSVLAKSLSFVWAPSWLGGIVVGALALGRYGIGTPLALAPLYPVMSFLYMQT